MQRGKFFEATGRPQLHRVFLVHEFQHARQNIERQVCERRLLPDPLQQGEAIVLRHYFIRKDGRGEEIGFRRSQRTLQKMARILRVVEGDEGVFDAGPREESLQDEEIVVAVVDEEDGT